MSDDIRNELRRLIKELDVTQAQLVRQLNREQSYSVSPSEFSTAINGLNTPKNRRILSDALGILIKEKMREQALIDLAKEY